MQVQKDALSYARSVSSVGLLRSVPPELYYIIISLFSDYRMVIVQMQNKYILGIVCVLCPDLLL